jgi:SNF2 family DNA or RNA helicase
VSHAVPAEREALAADANAREQRLLTRRAQLEEHFRGLAQGREWYEGIFPHQWSGACYGAVAERWFLGDEPGAGKTRTSIAWLDLIEARRVILVAEANVCAQFTGEIMELAPHRTIINLAGLAKATRHERLNKLLKMPEGVAVINYEMFRRDDDALAKLLLWRADTVIVDEAHNMKNIKTSNYKHVEKIVFANNTCPSCNSLIYGLERPCGFCGWTNPFKTSTGWNREVSSLKGDSRLKDAKKMFLSTKSVKNLLEMTGTPILNTPVDLYSIFHLIDPISFPSESWFKTQFTHPDYSVNRHVFSRKGLEKLSPLLKNRYQTRTLEEVGIYLPKQRVHIERVEIDPKVYPLQARTIEQVSKHAAIMLSTGESTTLMHMIAIILRKRQANVWPGGIEIRDLQTGEVVFSVGQEVQESAKMDAMLHRILEQHKQGKRQIVFSQFQTALAEFEQRAQKAGLRVARFDGTTSKDRREEIKNNFYKAKNEPAKWDLVLVHYKTGGAGLNLTAAEVTHILDEEWNAGKRDQAYARNHRIGQDLETDVFVYRAPGVDVWMANLIQMKERMVNRLGQAMGAEKQIQLMSEAIKKGEL